MRGNASTLLPTKRAPRWPFTLQWVFFLRNGLSDLSNLAGKVQSGGSFDVDYKVTGPNEKVILDGSKERQGDFVFTANDPGEYSFCFSNDMSTFAEKMVDFEIAVGV